MTWLRSLLSAVRAGQGPPPYAPLPRPDPPVCVIGDLHGRADLLERMLEAIAARPDHARARLIWVGDMIDRGPDSAAVLRRLHALQRAEPDRVICLMGNHERMLLDFLEHSADNGPRWIAAGGAETLTSFGLSPFIRRRHAGDWDRLAEDLRAGLSPATVDWLGALPLLWRTDRLGVSHAGADPRYPFETQAPRQLLRGAGRRARAPRRDGMWIAQGHVITPAPYASAGRICLDTGAWRSGTLSAAWIDTKGLSFFNVCGNN